MTRETAQFYSMLTARQNQLRAGLRAPYARLELFCESCGHDTPHTFTRGPVWTTVACTACGRAADFREG